MVQHHGLVPEDLSELGHLFRFVGFSTACKNPEYIGVEMILGHAPQHFFDSHSFVVSVRFIEFIQKEGLGAAFDLSMAREQAGDEEFLGRCCSFSLADSLGKLLPGV